MGKEQVVGNIQFGNNRISHAFAIIQEEYVDGKMWQEEYYKSEYRCDELQDEIVRLKKLLAEKEKKSGRKKQG